MKCLRDIKYLENNSFPNNIKGRKPNVTVFFTHKTCSLTFLSISLMSIYPQPNGESRRRLQLFSEQ